MNRLAGMKCYLIGAMDRVADGGVGWRREITPWLQTRGVFVLDPSDKPILGARREEEGRDHIHQLKERGEYDMIRALYGDDIRGNDLRFVDESSFLICYLDMDQHPCGTYEEWFTANRDKKPIITVVKQGKKAAPNWLFLAINHQLIFGSFDEAKEYLEHINTYPHKIETFNRWRFFDWARLVRETCALHGAF